MSMSFNDAMLVRQAAFGECNELARQHLIRKGYAVADPKFRVLPEAADIAAERLPLKDKPHDRQ